MNWRHIVWAVASATLWSIIPARAFAADTVVLAGQTRGKLAKRVREEIQALGIPVQQEPTWSPDRAQQGSEAIVVIVPTNTLQAVEVWRCDSSTLRWSRVEAIPRTVADPAIDARAVKTAELVRALRQRTRSHVVELEFEPVLIKPPDARSSPQFIIGGLPQLGMSADQPIVLLSKPKRRSRIRLSTGVNISAQYFGPAISMAFSGKLQLTHRFSAGFFVEPSVLGSSMSRLEGTATFRTLQVGLEIDGVVFRRNGLCGMLVGGAGLSTVFVSGQAVAPFVDRNEMVTTAMPYVGAKVRPRMTATTSLEFGIRIASAIPHFDVLFGGQRIGTWGLLEGALTVGISYEP